MREPPAVEHVGHASGTRLPAPRTLFILAVCCVCVVFAVYSRSLNFQFVLDDHNFTADTRIQEPGHVVDYFANYVWAQFTGGPPSFYRPVFLLWMRINFALSALSPWGWHLLSIAKHALVATLLGTLIWQLLGDWAAALAMGMLFALHPAQAESVSWVTVPDPLMSAGLLGALLFYLKYLNLPAFASHKSPAPRPKRSRNRRASQISKPARFWLVGSTAAYFAALLSKETAIIFPAVILGVALCVAPAQPRTNESTTGHADFRERLAKALLHVAPFACVTLLYLFLRFSALGGRFGTSTQHLPWRTVMLSSPAILWFYVKVMLWPVKSHSYADPLLLERLSLRGVLFPLFALTCFAAVVAVLSLRVLREAQRELGAQRAIAVKVAIVLGILLLVLPLLPALDLNALNPGDFLHGRYTYLPLAGLMLLMATWCCLLRKFSITWLSVAASLMIAFGILTFSQEAQWKDDSTHFTIAHELAPHNVPVAKNLANTHVNQGLSLADEGRCSEALPIFNQVIQDYPEDWMAWSGVAVCYVQLNDLPRAETALHRAADISNNTRVIQQWQELRAHMGLPAPPP